MSSALSIFGELSCILIAIACWWIVHMLGTAKWSTELGILRLSVAIMGFTQLSASVFGWFHMHLLSMALINTSIIILLWSVIHFHWRRWKRL